MRLSSQSSFPVFLAAALSVAGAAQAEEDSTTPAEAGKSFRRVCSKCHTVPDPGSAFDRAWLDQIHRTA